MKTKIFVVAILNCLIATFSTAQNFQWAKSASGINSENNTGVALDQSGNIYVTGYYDSPTISFGTTTLSNTGSKDIYLVKYDSNGNVLWVQTATGSSYNYAECVSTDCGVGHVIITGEFGGSLTFPTTPTATTLTASSGGADIFIAEYDANGSVLWAKSAGGSSSDFAYSVVTDYACNIYITGYFNSPTITFGSTTLTNTTTGWNNVFLAKYDTSGNVMWARSAGATGTSGDRGKSVAHNNNGIYITGNFSNSITFGSTTLTSVGSDDIFLANYDLNGNVIWAVRAGGALDETGICIAANANSNNIYLTGNFNSSSFTFGTTTLTNTSFAPFYSDDVFVAKYDSIGNVLWVKTAGGIHQDRASAIASDVLAQNVFVTGNFLDTMNFGTSSLISSGASSTVFVAKYDLNGNELWTKAAGGSSNDASSGIAVNSSGNTGYLAGTYTSSPIIFDLNTLNNAGGGDGFLVKIFDLTVGEDFPVRQNEVSVYPNPTSGMFTISSSFIVNEISIYNVLGERIYYSHTPQLNDNIIDLSRNPSGVYYIEINCGDKSMTKKIIIK